MPRPPLLLAAALGLASAGTLLAAPPGGCPAPQAVLARLEAEAPLLADRPEVAGRRVPRRLVAEAASSPGDAAVARDGKDGFGALVEPLPVAPVWKALNDEDHHALGGRYLPVEHSEIIGGTPRGESRLLFQWFERFGIGRWWVSRVEMDRGLYRDSGGALWELHWHDVLSQVDRSRPPISRIAARMRPIVGSRGSWLLLPLGEGCTLIEYSTWSDPGGVIGGLQGLVAKRALRDTLEGVVRLAVEHIPIPHPGALFVRPDGTPLP